MTQIEKHEKAIKILLAIQECNKRIASHERYADKFTCSGLISNASYQEYRIEINTKIKSRLENYYKTFKI
jgi:hypothetical protein